MAKPKAMITYDVVAFAAKLSPQAIAIEDRRETTQLRSRFEVERWLDTLPAPFWMALVSVFAESGTTRTLHDQSTAVYTRTGWLYVASSGAKK